jgi:hypothetical protein
MEVFGITLSPGEVVTIAVIISGAIWAFAQINFKLSSIIDRNKDADLKLGFLEDHLTARLAETKAGLEARMHTAEDRITRQEISSGRFEEKLLFIQAQLGRVLDLLENKNHDQNK